MNKLISKIIEDENRGHFISGHYLINGEGYYISISVSKEDGGYKYKLRNFLNLEQIGDNDVSSAPEIEEYIKNNLEEIVDNAVLALASFHQGPRSYVIVDDTGIHRLKADNSTQKLVSFDYWIEFREIYNEIAYPLIGSMKCYPSEKFYSKMANEHDSISVDEALDYLKDHPEEFTKRGREKADPNDPIVSIKNVDITRRTGNTDNKTFDFVSVELLLKSNLQITDMKTFIRDNLVDFNMRALEKIASTKKYQNYGVPVSFLTLYSIGTFMKTSIKMMYELPEISIE